MLAPPAVAVDEDRAAAASRECSAVYLDAARSVHAGNVEPAIALIRDGALQIRSESSPRAQLKTMLCLDLAERLAEAVPHLIQVLADYNSRNRSDEPVWVVHVLASAVTRGRWSPCEQRGRNNARTSRFATVRGKPSANDPSQPMPSEGRQRVTTA